MATGTNVAGPTWTGASAVAGADLDGRFRWVTGFWDPVPDRPGPSPRP